MGEGCWRRSMERLYIQKGLKRRSMDLYIQA